MFGRSNLASQPAGIGGLSILNIPNTTPYQNYVWKLQQWPLINWLVKFGVSGSITYHLLGGLRHLVRSCGCVIHSSACEVKKLL